MKGLATIAAVLAFSAGAGGFLATDISIVQVGFRLYSVASDIHGGRLRVIIGADNDSEFGFIIYRP